MSLIQNRQRNFFSDKFVIWSIHVDLSCVLFLVTNGQYVLRPLQDSLLFSSLLFSSLLFSSLLFSSLLFSSLLFSSLLFSSLLFSSLLFSSLLFSSLLFSSLLFSSLLFSSLLFSSLLFSSLLFSSILYSLFSILYSFVQSNAGRGGFTRTICMVHNVSATNNFSTTFQIFTNFYTFQDNIRFSYCSCDIDFIIFFFGSSQGGAPRPSQIAKTVAAAINWGTFARTVNKI